MRSYRPIFAIIALLACAFVPPAFSSVKNFEIYNKDKKEIFVTKIVLSGGTMQPDLQKAKRTPIYPLKWANAVITVTDPSNYKIDLEIEHGGLNFLFTIKPGDKDALVTFDTNNKNNILHPETGPSGGWAYKTVSGLSLGMPFRPTNLAQTNIEEKEDTEFLKFAKKTRAELMKLPTDEIVKLKKKYESLQILKDSEFIAFTKKTRADLEKLSVDEITNLKDNYEKFKTIKGFPEGAREVAAKLWDVKSVEGQEILRRIMVDEDFRDRLRDYKTGNRSVEALVKALQDFMQGVEFNKEAERVKKLFNPTFAAQWQAMSTKGLIKLDAWRKSEAKLDMFAKAYKEFHANAILSIETIKKFLPERLDEIEAINNFSKYLVEESKGFFGLKIEVTVFNNFINNVSLDLKDKSSFVQVEKFYKYYSEQYKLSPWLLLKGLRNATVFTKLSPNQLGQVKDLMNYAFEFMGNSPYPAELVGEAMASVIRELGPFDNSVEKTLVSNGVTKVFKNRFPPEVFRLYVQRVSDLDNGETQLLLNGYYTLITQNFEDVKVNNLEWCQKVGTFVKSQMKAGFKFTEILAALNSYPFSKTGKPEISALNSLARDLTKPAIDRGKISKAIHEHPFKVGGAFLSEIIKGLMPEEYKFRASSIRDGFDRLDSLRPEIEMVSKAKQMLKNHEGLVTIILPAALEGGKQVPNLLSSISTTVAAKLKEPPEAGTLNQMADVVKMIADQVDLLRTKPDTSFFQGMPLTAKEQEDARSYLGKIDYLGYVGFVADYSWGRSTLEWMTESAIWIFVRGDSKQEEQFIPPIVASLAPALPEILKNFSIVKYLDFLLQVGMYKNKQITGKKLEQEIWKFLGIVADDLAKLTKHLPLAFEAIRRFGIDDVTEKKQ